MPNLTIQQALELGLQHHRSGNLDAAQKVYETILAQMPQNAQAKHLLGVVAIQKGRSDVAVGLIQQAIALAPDSAEAYSDLSIALRNVGQLDNAIGACVKAVSLKPNFPGAHNNLGAALKDKGQLDDACEAFKNAAKLNPNYAEAHGNLSSVLVEKELFDEAIAHASQAVALQNNYVEAHYNLARAFLEKGLLDEAVAAARGALALRNDLPQVHCTLGSALLEKHQLPEAMAAYRQAIAMNKDYAEAHWNLALALLTTGDFAAGWTEYEWRWQVRSVTTATRNFPQPLWDGTSLAGKTILLHAEQGLGDTLQFVRFLPVLAEQGAKIVMECQRPLHRLLTMMNKDYQVMVQDTWRPKFDVHCPLLTLPKMLNTTLETIPQTVPYLRADEKDVEQWRDRVSPHATGMKVGIVWAGTSTYRKDRHRSITPARFAALAQITGVKLFSLQKGWAGPSAAVGAGIDLIDLTGQINDFADTAALIANLDLVITVDTAVAHLAGAMGKTVWTLLPFAADWRWMLDRADSPWYPTMRLFRQPALGDWDSVMREVGQALEHLANLGK